MKLQAANGVNIDHPSRKIWLTVHVDGRSALPGVQESDWGQHRWKPDQGCPVGKLFSPLCLTAPPASVSCTAFTFPRAPWTRGLLRTEPQNCFQRYLVDPVQLQDTHKVQALQKVSQRVHWGCWSQWPSAWGRLADLCLEKKKAPFLQVGLWNDPQWSVHAGTGTIHMCPGSSCTSRWSNRAKSQ